MHLKDLKCWKSPFRDEIIQMIKDGKADTFIGSYLKSAGKPINRISIAKFRKALTPQEYFKEKFDEIDKVIDAVKRHLKTIELTEKRMVEFREKELTERLHAKGSEKPSYMLNDVTKIYNKLLETHVKMKQSLGMVPTAVKNIPEKVQKTQREILEQARKKAMENG